MTDQEAYELIRSEFSIYQQFEKECLWMMGRLREWVEARGLVPRNVLEIGSLAGANIAMLSRLMEDSGKLISIDPQFVLQHPIQVDLIRHSIGNIEYYHIDRKSESPESPELLEKILDGERLDILFIDGDHTYAGARADYDTYSSYVAVGGVILIHDIGFMSSDKGVMVGQLWNDVRFERPSESYYECAVWGLGGIGITYL